MRCPQHIVEPHRLPLGQFIHAPEHVVAGDLAAAHVPYPTAHFTSFQGQGMAPFLAHQGRRRPRTHPRLVLEREQG
ncbi:hypothetical protein D3C72_2300270 [compost metagenome]